jgi:AraC-like DNA-binding protein
MAFSNLVSQRLACSLSGYYKLDKELYDECLEGLPAYTNALLSGIDSTTGKREIAYFIPQGEMFDKKQFPEIFNEPYLLEIFFFDALVEGIPVFGIPGLKTFKISSIERLSGFCSLVSYENTNSYLFKESIVSATLEKISLYVLRDLHDTFKDMFSHINQHFENDRLMKILMHIHQNLQKDITLEHLAELISLSPDYISQFFKRCIGMSIQAYLIDQRVKLGLHFLVSTSDQIAGISDKTGFIDQAYFNRRFKMFYGVNPLRMRKKYQLMSISQAGFLMTWPRV